MKRTPEQERIIRERDDKAMISDEDLWTHWPVLPVVNRKIPDDPNVCMSHGGHP
mgnify:CR=1 FL=1